MTLPPWATSVVSTSRTAELASGAGLQLRGTLSGYELRRWLQGAMAELRGATSKGARGIHAVLHGPIAKSHSAGNFFATRPEVEGVRSNSSHWLTSLRAWFSGRVRRSNNDEACRHSRRPPPAIDPVNCVKARVVLPISQR